MFFSDEEIARGRRILDAIIDDFPQEVIEAPAELRIPTLTLVLMSVGPAETLILLTLAIDKLVKARSLEKVVHGVDPS